MCTIASLNALWLGAAVCADPVASVSAPDAVAEVGICPEALVAADLHGYMGIIFAAAEAAQDLRQTLYAYDATAKTAALDLAAIAQTLSLTGPTPTLLAQREAASTALQSARSGLLQTRELFFDRLMLGLPTESVLRLRHWKQSGAYAVPAEFRIKQRNDAEWKVIAGAVRAEVRALRLGEACNQEQAQVLEQLRTDPEIIAAKTRLTTVLGSAQATFQQYCAGGT